MTEQLTADNRALAACKGCILGPFMGLDARWQLRPTPSQHFLKRPKAARFLGPLLAECFLLPDADEVAPYSHIEPYGFPRFPDVRDALVATAKRKGYHITWVRFAAHEEVYRATRNAVVPPDQPDLYMSTESARVMAFLNEQPDLQSP